MSGTVASPRQPTREKGTSKARSRAWLNRRPRTIATYVLSVVTILVLWEVMANRYGVPLLFPQASITAEAFVERLVGGDLVRDSAASLARILAGFAIGSLLGVVLGLLVGSFAITRALAEPFINFFRFVPPLAWFAPVLLWFGTGEFSRVLLIVYTTIFVVTINVVAGVNAVPRNKTRMAASFGASRRQVFFRITLPAAAPYLFNGMRIAMGNSFMTVVAAEMLAAQTGLGALVNRGLIFLDLTRVFTGIVVLGILGFLTDRTFRVLTQRFGGRYVGAVEAEPL